MRRWAWIIGAVGLMLSILGWIADPGRFAFAWLASVVIWLGWPLGCLALLFVHVLTGGRWGELLRPALAAGIGTLPLLLPALVPVALLSQHLFPWLRPEDAADLKNTFYLNAPFAAARWAAFVVIWFGLGAFALRAWRRGGPSPAVAVIGLILLGLTVTFAGFDLILSLEPRFNSSNFGMIVGSQYGLFGLTIATGMTTMTVPPRAPGYSDLGRLLMGMLVLWAYQDFMQLLIVWQSDLPHEASWYVHRTQGPWGILTTVLAAGHFLLPFAALLWPRLRNSPRGIGTITTLLILMEFLRGWWLVLPAGNHAPGWIDIGTTLCLGGISAGLALPARREPIREPRHV
jgi:hypothetical protein